MSPVPQESTPRAGAPAPVPSESSAASDADDAPPPAATGDAEDALPLLVTVPAAEGVHSPEDDTQLSAVRRFCAGALNGTGTLPAAHLPALLFPFRDSSRVRGDYPLLLSDEDGPLACISVGDALDTLLERCAPGEGDARFLRDNLLRLERSLIGVIRAEHAESPGARSVLERASRRMAEELALGGENGAQLDAELAALAEQMPASASWVSEPEAILSPLLERLTRGEVGPYREARREETLTLAHRLADLLAADEAKRGATAERGFGGDVAGRIDPTALADITRRKRGAVTLPAERRLRIDGWVERLEGFAADTAVPARPLFICSPRVPEHLRPDADAIACEDPCGRAVELFEECAAAHARAFGALRAARLELEDAFEPARHGPYLESFDWQAFRREELLAMPPVVVCAPAAEFDGPVLATLSRLLRSGRPVHVLALVEPSETTCADGTSHFELGYFGISHREVFVQHGALARPAQLRAGLARALGCPRPSLHLLVTGDDLSSDDDEERPLSSWLRGGAAVESRAHPLFIYDPEGGVSWAQRMTFAGNPQEESDWSLHSLAYRDEEGATHELEVAFTLADLALLHVQRRGEFCAIPADTPDEALAPLAEAVTDPEGDAAGRVPYVLAVDDAGRLQRFAVSRRLLLACRDRLDYWRTLQEFAGVRNEYVERAVEQTRREDEERAAAERESLEAQHRAELEQVQAEAAGRAMERLAAILLQKDVLAGPATLPAAVAATPMPAAAPAAAAETPAHDAEEESEKPTAEPTPPAAEEPISEEPWIDSVLCTSCNDCVELNPQMFVYNGDKQATIGDASAGTFEQLVVAAEKCPSKCIHPGSPLSPDEPDLAALVERAKPFN